MRDSKLTHTPEIAFGASQWEHTNLRRTRNRPCRITADNSCDFVDTSHCPYPWVDMGGGHLIFFEMEFQTKSTESTESTCPATVHPCLACCKSRNKTRLPAGLRKERKVRVWNSFAVNIMGKYRIDTHKNEILFIAHADERIHWISALKRETIWICFDFLLYRLDYVGCVWFLTIFHVFGCLRGLGNRPNQYWDGIIHHIDPCPQGQGL